MTATATSATACAWALARTGVDLLAAAAGGVRGSAWRIARRPAAGPHRSAVPATAGPLLDPDHPDRRGIARRKGQGRGRATAAPAPLTRSSRGSLPTTL